MQYCNKRGQSGACSSYAERKQFRRSQYCNMRDCPRPPFSLRQTPSPPKADCRSPLGKPSPIRPESRCLYYKGSSIEKFFAKKFGSFRNLSYLCTVKRGNRRKDDNLYGLRGRFEPRNNKPSLFGCDGFVFIWMLWHLSHCSRHTKVPVPTTTTKHPQKLQLPQ